MLREGIKALVSGFVVCLIGACGSSHGEGAKDVPGDAGFDVKVDAGVDASPDIAEPETAKAESEADAAGPDAAPIDANECKSGTQGCEGDSIRQCLGGNWSVIEPPCEFGCNDGSCMNCRPGAKRCNGLAVVLCSANGSGWSHLANCETVCLPSAECGGECARDECTDAMTLVRCENGKQVSVGPCEWGCNQDRNECNVCGVGAVTCSKYSDQLWSLSYCLDDGSGWTDPSYPPCWGCSCALAGETGLACVTKTQSGTHRMPVGEDTCNVCSSNSDVVTCTP